jgi:hypothetical protein
VVVNSDEWRKGRERKRGKKWEQLTAIFKKKMVKKFCWHKLVWAKGENKTLNPLDLRHMMNEGE